MLIWSGIFALLAPLRFSLITTGYDISHLSVDVYLSSLSSVSGWPLVGLTCAWLAGLILFLMTFIKKITRDDGSSSLAPYSVLAVLVGGGAFIAWSADPTLWSSALPYRDSALICSLPFIGFAVLEALISPARNQDQPGLVSMTRLLVIQSTAVIFGIVLGIQSFSFVVMTQQLSAIIDASQTPCIGISKLRALNKTAFGHWSITAYSILLQGRHPTKIVLSDNACTHLGQSDGFPLAEFSATRVDKRYFTGGWFDMQALAHEVQPQSVAATAVASGTTSAVANAPKPDTRPMCFPEIGQCITGVFRTYWNLNGGRATFGLPVGGRLSGTPMILY